MIEAVRCTRVAMAETGRFKVMFVHEHEYTWKPYIQYKQCESDAVVDAIDSSGNVYHWCEKCAKMPTCGGKIIAK